MTVRIVPGSANITIDHEPGVVDPTVHIEPPRPIHTLNDALVNLARLIEGNKAWFLSARIAATGTVTLDRTAAGDDATHWELGFLQVRWVRTTWAHYKANWTDGAAIHGGSMLLQAGKPPAMTSQTCRDTVDAGGDIWYAHVLNQHGNAGAFPQPLTATYNDSPQTVFPVVLTNSRTNQLNFLREVQVELLFCTALALREPGLHGRIHILKHFFWNVLWQATFQPTDFTNPWYAPWAPPLVDRDATQPHRSDVFDGEPEREPFRHIFKSHGAEPVCNDLARNAFRGLLHPPFRGRREEKNRDYDFNVKV
jgi:hypothetical protein